MKLLKFRKIFDGFKDYYSDFKIWLQQIPIDTSISEVKLKLPSFVIVDWENPEKFGKGLLYRVDKIKGHSKSSSVDYLGFLDDLYSGHVFRK